MLTSLLRLPTVSSPHHLHQFLLFLRAHQPQSLPDLNVLSPLSAPLFTHAHFTTSHILQLASLIPSHPVTIPCKAQFLGPFPLSFHLHLPPLSPRPSISKAHTVPVDRLIPSIQLFMVFFFKLVSGFYHPKPSCNPNSIAKHGSLFTTISN